MTKERNRPDPAAATDPLVTRTYREAADERAPGHLDRAILKEAAQAVRPRYSRFITWTRPMAWAATVMLSVALVLELTRVPAPTVILEPGTGKFELRELEYDSRYDAPAELLEEPAPPEAMPAALPGRAADGETAAATEAAAMKPAANQTAAAGLDKHQNDNLRQGQAAKPVMTAPATHIEEFKLKDADELRRYEDKGRLQKGAIGEATFAGSAEDAAGADSATRSTAAMAVETPRCEEAVIAAPETWLECIAELEKAGLADEARLQRDLLREAFPGFDAH
jgi:hypothetical protein